MPLTDRDAVRRYFVRLSRVTGVEPIPLIAASIVRPPYHPDSEPWPKLELFPMSFRLAFIATTSGSLESSANGAQSVAMKSPSFWPPIVLTVEAGHWLASVAIFTVGLCWRIARTRAGRSVGVTPQMI